MLGRTAALIAATAVSTGVVASAATAASGPPPPPTATNGHVVQLVASGLHTPTSFAFGGGTVFEGDGGVESKTAPPNGGVFVLKNGAATEIPGSPGFVAGLAWHQGALYVSGGSITATGPKWQLWKWSGWNGTTFASQKAIYTAPKKFQGFNGIAFGADGRLYVGVDTGLLDNNDHGPASLSPFLYDILSFKSNGTGRQVFATGIRQPWQMAFPKGSSSPFVSDLGQDSGAKNPPDFILRVHKGDNFGFPGCNWTSGEQVHRVRQAVRAVRSPHRPHGHGHHGQAALHDLVHGYRRQGRGRGPLAPAVRWQAQAATDGLCRSDRRARRERRLALRR